MDAVVFVSVALSFFASVTSVVFGSPQWIRGYGYGQCASGAMTVVYTGGLAEDDTRCEDLLIVPTLVDELLFTTSVVLVGRAYVLVRLVVTVVCTVIVVSTSFALSDFFNNFSRSTPSSVEIVLGASCECSTHMPCSTVGALVCRARSAIKPGVIGTTTTAVDGGCRGMTTTAVEDAIVGVGDGIALKKVTAENTDE